MRKMARNGSSGQFTVSSGGGKRATVRDNRTGQTLPLKGYGAFKGEYEVIKGIDLTKPIAAQAQAVRKKTTARNEPTKRG